ncbi:MAG: HigA family addiction module antidote protein [Candidatus Latescibacteria bacterium]|nr:HigA family addiction module antidote protein [Candidatus Latescibacterota bacterium]
MIKSFKDKETEKLFRGQFSRKLPQNIQRVAARKLEQLNAATVLETLRVPPGNRLEALSHDRQGQHSIRVNDQWRVCFIWRNDNAFDAKRDFPPIHPGEILFEDFLKPLQINQYHLARSIGVPPRRINEIVHGKRGITADTALRLGRFFRMEAQFWMNLQTRYELETTLEALADRLDQEVQMHPV